MGHQYCAHIHFEESDLHEARHHSNNVNFVFDIFLPIKASYELHRANLKIYETNMHVLYVVCHNTLYLY